MRVLHVIHDFLPRHRAGSEIYAYELARAQQRLGLEVHVLCAEYDPAREHGTLEWRFVDDLPVTELVNNWRFASFADSYASPDLGARLEHVLRAVQPDVLHVHNLLNLSFELPAIASRLGVPSVATLHEYVLVCPSGGQRVHLADEHLCNEIDPGRCARCFVESPFWSQMAFARLAGGGTARRLATHLAGALRRRLPVLAARAGAAAARSTGPAPVTPADIEARLAAARRVFETVELWVAPSPALASELRRLGMPGERIEVSDYGFAPLGPAPRSPGDGRLRIGFVGTLVWHKGAHVLVEAVRRLPVDRVEARIFGGLDTFPDYTARLRRAAEGLPVRLEGGFDRDRVAEVYAGMDVLAICSLWPENSPLVIHEAFMAGVPVVGARMGGIADLVSDGVNGLLYDAFSAEDLADRLRRLLDEPELLERLRGARTPVKTIDHDAEDWLDRYRRVAAAAVRRPAPSGQ